MVRRNPWLAGLRLGRLATWLEYVRRVWDENVVDYGLTQQWQLISEAGSALKRSGHSLRWSRHDWRRYAPWLYALGAVFFVFATWLVRRWYWRRRHAATSPLLKALTDAIERLTGAPLREAETIREAVGAAWDALGPDDAKGQALLNNALTRYEHDRFHPGSNRWRQVRRSVAYGIGNERPRRERRKEIRYGQLIADLQRLGRS